MYSVCIACECSTCNCIWNCTRLSPQLNCTGIAVTYCACRCLSGLLAATGCSVYADVRCLHVVMMTSRCRRCISCLSCVDFTPCCARNTSWRHQHQSFSRRQRYWGTVFQTDRQMSLLRQRRTGSTAVRCTTSTNAVSTVRIHFIRLCRTLRLWVYRGRTVQTTWKIWQRLRFHFIRKICIIFTLALALDNNLLEWNQRATYWSVHEGKPKPSFTAISCARLRKLVFCVRWGWVCLAERRAWVFTDTESDTLSEY